MTSPKVSRGSSVDVARLSLLDTPLWLPVTVAAVAVVALDVVVPAATSGGIAAFCRLLGVAVAAGMVLLIWLRWQARHRMRTLLRSLHTTDDIAGMTQLEVHDLVSAALLRRGWHPSEAIAASQDDSTVVMTSERVKRAIFFVRNSEVLTAEALQTMERSVRGRARPLVVTTGGFDASAVTFARQVGMELVDGNGVLSLMQELRGEAPAIGPLPAPVLAWKEPQADPAAGSRPTAAEPPPVAFPPGRPLPGTVTRAEMATANATPAAANGRPPLASPPSAPGPSGGAPLAESPAVTAPRAPQATAGADPLCPDCGSTMKMHQSTATDYWVCKRFPECAGMVVAK